MEIITKDGQKYYKSPPIQYGKYKVVNLHPVLSKEEKEKREKEQYRRLSRLLLL